MVVGKIKRRLPSKSAQNDGSRQNYCRLPSLRLSLQLECAQVCRHRRRKVASPAATDRALRGALGKGSPPARLLPCYLPPSDTSDSSNKKAQLEGGH